MSRSSFRGLVALLSLLIVPLIPRESVGQSLFARSGAGYVTEPVDARARALGGVALGLPGASLSLVNPAGPVGLPAPALIVAFQPDFYSTRLGSAENSGTAARFPLIHAAFPVGSRWLASIGYGAYLDQNWRVESDDTVQLSTGPAPVRDLFASRGGAGRFRIGAGYLLSDAVAVGVGADLYTGALRDSVARSCLGGFTPTVSTTTRSYSGVGAVVGIKWRAHEAATLAAAVSGGGSLRSNPEEGDSLATTRTTSLPLSVDLGGSARVTSNTLLALSTRWTGWSTADEELADRGGARDVMSASAGLEYEALSFRTRVFPLRVGARWTQLPFSLETADQRFEAPTERALSGGVGARLAGGAAFTDVALERGWRGGEAAGIDESFWRVSLSLTLLGR